MSDQAELFQQLWLPLFPFASDDLRNGIYRMNRGEALKRRLIQANPDAMANLLVVDCDHPDAALRAVTANGSHPMPNAVVENPRNGHAHVVWALAEPVTKTERAHLKPLTYAAAITEGLRRAVDGDVGYSGLLTKNPEHEAWRSEWFTDQLYSLPDIERGLGENMPERGWSKGRKRGEINGLGRNCSLFETSRHWAYRELRNWFGNPLGLSTAIHAGVHERNLEFAEPLPAAEADGIARSITSWITTKSRLWNDGAVVYDATFSVIQSSRARRLGEIRRARRGSILAELEKAIERNEI